MSDRLTSQVRNSPSWDQWRRLSSRKRRMGERPRSCAAETAGV